MRRAATHGHVGLVGDIDDDEGTADEPMAWTPESDPDQLHYNALPPDEDEEDDEASEEELGGEADLEDDGPPRKAATLADALQELMQRVRERFSQVRVMPMPQGLRRKQVTFALFVQSDGRVKVLR